MTTILPRIFARKVDYAFTDKVTGCVVWHWEWRGNYYISDGRFGMWMRVNRPMYLGEEWL